MAGSIQINEWEFVNLFPLHHACKEGNVQKVADLLESDRSLGVLEDSVFGWTPSHWAAYFGKFDCLRSVASLVPNGVNIQSSKLCVTPAHTAAEGGRPQCLLWLLQAGANVNIKDHAGETPLHKAARSGSAECVSLLIAASCNIRITNNVGETASIIAEQNGHSTVAAYIHQAELLRELGGNTFYQHHTLSHGQPCRKRTIDGMNCSGFSKRLRVEAPADDLVHMSHPMRDISTSQMSVPTITSSVVEHEKLRTVENGYVHSLFECFLNQFHGC